MEQKCDWIQELQKGECPSGMGDLLYLHILLFFCLVKQFLVGGYATLFP